ncbi:MAG: hypothetical protein B5M53_00735 [Candidatus Cloacimonas sp. 4484_209]|nr:MAG: hypothetical protein B5M53_00735 [Candidatus Cloacimonas sp. 4484_209]
MSEEDIMSQVTKAINKIYNKLYNKLIQKEEFEEKKRLLPLLPKKQELKKPLEKPKPFLEEMSPELERLLKERDEWRIKLEKLKDQKEKLISEGLMTERIYKERYEEIMDQLVDIEDKIIQEKMKGGGKK